MPFINTKIKNSRSLGGNYATEREQRRLTDEALEMRNEKMPTIFLKEFAFRPQHTLRGSIRIDGPLCPRQNKNGEPCLSPLVTPSPESQVARCDVCDTDYKLPYPYQRFREVAHLAYEGFKNRQSDLITLDVPYEAIKAKSEDETRKIKVVWSQKDGRNQAIIYLIGKNDKGAKTHIFADLDREEIRYDPGDIPPGIILAKIKAEFEHTKIEIKYSK